MLHACVQGFDVTRNFEKICKILGTKQALENHWWPYKTEMQLVVFFRPHKNSVCGLASFCTRCMKRLFQVYKLCLKAN